MSKKDRRIKDLEETLRASVARNALWAREHRELFDAYELVRDERDEWRNKYNKEKDELRSSISRNLVQTNGWRDALFSVSELIAERNDLQWQVDSMAHDLGECQAGREALGEKAQRWQKATYVQADARDRERARRDKLRAENAELKKELIAMQKNIETAHRWKTYATSIESQIEILQTAIDERDSEIWTLKCRLADMKLCRDNQSKKLAHIKKVSNGEIGVDKLELSDGDE